ncbi:MAG TPA: cell wall hydrolase [Clostridiales bacterium]|nr:cell wall hydrolase [Clostridiales bacterium]
MRAVATVIMNRVHVSDGEYLRVCQGNLRNVIFQPSQFDCAATELYGTYNPQNIFNIPAEQVHYEIADWALGGGALGAVGDCLWYFNPFSPTCQQYFPRTRTGTFHTRIGNHCFYRPTQLYYQT